MIRVTETRVYEYSPDLEANFYLANNVTTVAEAMERDSKDVTDGAVIPEELATDLPRITYLWELIDDGVSND